MAKYVINTEERTLKEGVVVKSVTNREVIEYERAASILRSIPNVLKQANISQSDEVTLPFTSVSAVSHGDTEHVSYISIDELESEDTDSQDADVCTYPNCDCGAENSEDEDYTDLVRLLFGL